MPASQLLEYLVRRTYFTAPRIVEAYGRYKTRRLGQRSTVARWDSGEIARILANEVPGSSDLMLHSSMAGLGPNVDARSALELLLQVCGSHRSLLVPSHPALQVSPEGVPRYDPARSPSTVGLIAEIARRRPEFQRSLHPYASVAVTGPGTEMYLANNLNAAEPFPHGPDSPYGRIAERGGTVICLGIAFDECLSLIHVSEETLVTELPVRLATSKISVEVRRKGEWVPHTVRLRDSSMRAHFSMRSIQRDLPAWGVVRRFEVNGVLIDIVDAQATVKELCTRALESGYPYMYLPRRRGRRTN